MNYSFSPSPTHIKCVMKGEFTFNDHPTFRSMIDEAVKTGIAMVQLDLADVDYVDSAGLGMFLVANERASEEGWSFSITNPREKVKKMFQLAKLGTIVNIVEE